MLQVVDRIVGADRVMVDRIVDADRIKVVSKVSAKWW